MGWSADIANADSMRCKLHDPEYKLARYTEVVAAVNERAAAAGVATLSTPVRLDLWPEIRIAVQAKVSALFASFAKHTDSGGNWNGQTAIPAWTEADILTAISATRIPAAVSTDIPAWLNQQYKILNLLRWRYIDKSPSGPTSVNRIKDSNNSSLTPSSWANTVSDFDGKGFTTITPGFLSFSHFAYYSTTSIPGFDYYTIHRGGNSQSYSAQSINCTADLYFMFLDPPHFSGYTELYENADYPTAIKDKLYKVSSTGYTAGNAIDTSMGLINDCTITEPTVSNQTKGYSIEYNSLLLKFDVTGGFEYGDW